MDIAVIFHLTLADLIAFSFPLKNWALAKVFLAIHCMPGKLCTFSIPHMVHFIATYFIAIT